MSLRALCSLRFRRKMPKSIEKNGLTKSEKFTIIAPVKLLPLSQSREIGKGLEKEGRALLRSRRGFFCAWDTDMPQQRVKAELIDEQGLERTITRLAHEILERNRGTEKLALVGIRTRGAPLAARIARKIEALEGKHIPLGTLDITMYRDDFRRKMPMVRGTDIPFEIDDMNVVLVDDVLYTGRTARAALDALMDFAGRQRCNWRCWWTAGTGSCPSAPTTWARTSPPPSARKCRCASRRKMVGIACCSSPPRRARRWSSAASTYWNWKG